MARDLGELNREGFARYKDDVKKEGKPFFPRAIFHDTVMSLVVVCVIVALAAIWYYDADGIKPGILGPWYTAPADPATTSFVPRPDWYFYFLFYLLRIFQWPETVFIATVGIPTICLILLIMLPFIDRSPERHPARRPIAMLAGITTIGAMAYLTILGALAGSPTEIDIKVKPQFERGKEVAAASGCTACHKFGENGNGGPGPNLTKIGKRLPAAAIERTLLNPTAPMPSYASLKKQDPQKFNELVGFLASLK
jgi:menaquinol-cytochrome c reductase cytochrome b/c subunit